MIYYWCTFNNPIGEKKIFKRPKFDEYFYTTVRRFLDEDEPRIHDDVELKPGEKVGLLRHGQAALRNVANVVMLPVANVASCQCFPIANVANSQLSMGAAILAAHWGLRAENWGGGRLARNWANGHLARCGRARARSHVSMSHVPPSGLMSQVSCQRASTRLASGGLSARLLK